MNEHEQSHPELPEDLTIDEFELDRLVDGELEEPRRRELLARLEAIPEGWRRCAMAFLEAQCWRESFGKAFEDADHPATAESPSFESKPVPAKSIFSVRRSHLHVMVAMAASFLIALFGVWHFRGGGDPVRPISPPTSDVVSDVAAPRFLQKKPPQQPVISDRPSEPWKIVNVARTDRDAPPVQYPAVERDRFDRGDVDRLSDGTPLHFVKSLKDSGHHVERSRSYVPVRLEDGRRMVVPVDDYDVKRGFPRYQ